LIGRLSGQHRGRLRELGLTTKPSNSVVRANPIGSAREEGRDRWAGKLRIT